MKVLGEKNSRILNVRDGQKGNIHGKERKEREGFDEFP